jgi:predicted AlkP superfamily phosphohydrolase/phosphomutase
MTHKKNISRREFLKQSAIATAGITGIINTTEAFAKESPAANGKKVVVIGFDGMDPILSERMMNAGDLPNLDKLRKNNGYSVLGTSTPPQSPVAWANFINGADPGSHGIFDFIHRHPEKQFGGLFLSTSETVGGKTVLKRQGTPFWDYLDEAGIKSVFYDLPSNYPPSPSKHGNHKCLSGMGTPDMTGNYGGFHHFAEDGPVRTKEFEGCKLSMLFFENETASGALIGPVDPYSKKHKPMTIEFAAHRDKNLNTVIVEIQDKRLFLKPGQWSKWVRLDFELEVPYWLNKTLNGICRFYLQEIGENVRLYVTPINVDPSNPATPISEPNSFVKDISKELGLFYTSGMQEDFKALQNKIYNDDEFVMQADIVLKERLRLLDYAIKHYEDGLLYFYFSSTDLQAHMLWWDGDEKHPTRNKKDAKKYFGVLKDIYRKMDKVLGETIDKYGQEATIIVLSDHGFANFSRQFGLNKWLVDEGYIGPKKCTSLMTGADWSKTRAYGLGINGLYLNLKGRERDGIVESGREQEELLKELITKLQAIKDNNGKKVIKEVYRTDKYYSGPATRLAPDLIIGYSKGYRASWTTCLGDMDKEVISDNDKAWSADHCADPSVVPGVVFCNKPIDADKPTLIDIAPSILKQFGLEIPDSMQGKNIISG